jgi:hypothetical protein
MTLAKTLALAALLTILGCSQSDTGNQRHESSGALQGPMMNNGVIDEHPMQGPMMGNGMNGDHPMQGPVMGGSGMDQYPTQAPMSGEEVPQNRGPESR